MDLIQQYPWMSVLPPVLAIFLAIRTKQVYISLLFGIWLGWMILSDFNPLTGTLQTIEGLVDVFQDKGSTRTIIFSALVGALIIFIQKSGGVEGFVRWVNRLLKKYEEKQDGSNRLIVQLLAWLTGMLIFVETNISALTVGTLYRPIFDRLKIPREKLAYITDSSSSPASILIPFNAWGAFIMGLLVKEGFDNPFGTMFQAAGYNFYPILALIIVVIVILTKRDIGPMRLAENRTKTTGKLMNDDAKPMVSDELTAVTPKEGLRSFRPINMILPIGTMVVMMPIMLCYTGWAQSIVDNPDASGFQRIFNAIGAGSGSTSVLVSVIVAILLSMLLYKSQRIMGIREMVELVFKGISEMMPLALLMLFAFAIGNICKELGTGPYVAEVSQNWLSPGLVPFIVFLVSCFIAFSTGTSWGTFAIMIAIAVPMAKTMDAHIVMTIAAALGGGVFGDHCSPISDTSIISSMASASDHIDHVRTQIPYALIGGGITAMLYLILGLL